MKQDAQRWLGPGEAAAKLGVSIKALRVYEREGLVRPARTEGGWRAYGPDQIARIHLIVVLRELGFPIRAIRAVVEGETPSLARLLTAQQEALEVRRRRIGEVIALLSNARLKLAQGLALTPDDLITLTRETVVTTQDIPNEIDHRIQEHIERHLPPAEVSAIKGAVEAQAAANGRTKDDLKTEVLILMADARRLMAGGDPDSQEATAMVRRWKSVTQGIDRPGPDAMSDPTLAPDLPFDAEVLAFLKRVASGMKSRGELPEA